MIRIQCGFLNAILILSFSLLSFSSTQALAQQMDLSKESWSQLVRNILQNGTDMDSYDGTYRTLSYFHPTDKDQTHWAKYISAVGAQDLEGQFHAWKYHAVFEHWVLNEKNQWEIDQWLYVLNTQGQIQRIGHYFLKEEKDGHVLEHRQWETGSPQDPLEIQRFVLFLEPWISSTGPLSLSDPSGL